MKKLKIALEGAINSKTDEQCNGWREWVMRELGDKDFAYHNPMDLDCRGRERECREELVYFDTVGLGGAHVSLVYLPESSDGTLIGVQISWSLHRHVVETKEQAADYIRGLLLPITLPAAQENRARLMFHLEREKVW